MIPQRNATRVLATAGLAAATLMALSGCFVGADPSPSPSPTAAFASEEEAFAAAEETYGRYTEASNKTDLADPTTFDPVFAWLVGKAESAARENYSELHANGMQKAGATTIASFVPASRTDDSVIAEVCVDVSAVELVDAAGESVVPPDRPDRQALSVTFVTAATPTGFAISSSTTSSSPSC